MQSSHTSPPDLKEEDLQSSQVVAASDNQVFDKDAIAAHQVPSFYGSAVTDVNAWISLVSIGAVINAARRWPEILDALNDAIESNIYYLCNLHPIIREGVKKEGATLGAEANAYTTFLVVLWITLAIPSTLAMLCRYAINRKELQVLNKKLAEKNIKSRLHWFDLGFDLSFSGARLALHRLAKLGSQNQAEEKEESKHDLSDAAEVTLNINSSEPSDEFDEQHLLTAFKVYFTKLNNGELRQVADDMNTGKLPQDLFSRYPMPSNWWLRFRSHINWFRSELNHYMKPIALLTLIPGLFQAFQRSGELSKVTGCTLMAVFLDNCPEVEEVDEMSLEIFPWMWISFSVLTFFAATTLADVVTYPFKAFEKFRNYVSKKHHAYYENWCKEENWLYETIAWKATYPYTTTAIMMYSLWRSIAFVNRYAAKEGCGSLFNIMDGVYRETHDPYCPDAMRGLVLATFAGASEIGKFYMMYIMDFYATLIFSNLAKRVFNFEKRFPKEKAIPVLDRLCDEENTNLMMGGIGVLLGGITHFFTARHAGDRVLQQGITIAQDIPSWNQTMFDFQYYNNNTQSVLHDICPQNDIVALVKNAWDNLHVPQNATLTEIIKFLNSTANWKEPALVIQGNTIFYTLSKSCLETGLVTSYLLNNLENDPNCPEITTIRALGASIIVFWLACQHFGFTFFSLTALSHRLSDFAKAIKNYSSHQERSKEESMSVPVVRVDVPEAKSHALGELAEPLLNLRPRTPAHTPGIFKRAWNYIWGEKPSVTSFNIFNKNSPIKLSGGVPTPPDSPALRYPS